MLKAGGSHRSFSRSGVERILLSPNSRIELLKTFADQAVIRHRNTRLFKRASGAQQGAH